MMSGSDGARFVSGVNEHRGLIPIPLHNRTPQSRAFDALVERVQHCRACPRMEGRRRVLGAGNGNLTADVLFIAEAPGRLGADRTTIPLSGDQSGRNFERLLEAAELDRDAIFVTNAVLCNPRDNSGRNAPPTRSELQNCSGHLRETIFTVDPRIVVTLGAVALRSLETIEPHCLTLTASVGQVHAWNGCLLVPLYHPGPRAMIHRPFPVQLEDYRRLAQIIGAPPLPENGRGGRKSP